MPQTTAALIDRLDAILVDPGTAPCAESAVTDGCARALALEVERLRVVRRIAGIDEELEQLRSRLSAFRVRHTRD